MNDDNSSKSNTMMLVSWTTELMIVRDIVQHPKRCEKHERRERLSFVNKITEATS